MAKPNYNTSVPYWNELKDLSNSDKLAIIASLSASMIDDSKRIGNEEWDNALSLEDFRTEAKKRLKKIYG